MFISPFDIVMKSSQSAHRRIVQIKVSLFVSAYQATLHLYEESFAKNFNWEKHLYSDVCFHDLMHRELSTPIELHMGTVLPFIGACFCKALAKMQITLWLENGFGERFIFTSAKPYK